jgi:transposase InsO family protein
MSPSLPNQPPNLNNPSQFSNTHLDRHRWRTRVELANAIFEYLENFHNRTRRHSALGMLTPIQFENTPTVA